MLWVSSGASRSRSRHSASDRSGCGTVAVDSLPPPAADWSMPLPSVGAPATDSNVSTSRGEAGGNSPASESPAGTCSSSRSSMGSMGTAGIESSLSTKGLPVRSIPAASSCSRNDVDSGTDEDSSRSTTGSPATESDPGRLAPGFRRAAPGERLPLFPGVWSGVRVIVCASVRQQHCCVINIIIIDRTAVVQIYIRFFWPIFYHVLSCSIVICQQSVSGQDE